MATGAARRVIHHPDIKATCDVGGRGRGGSLIHLWFPSYFVLGHQIWAQARRSVPYELLLSSRGVLYFNIAASCPVCEPLVCGDERVGGGLIGGANLWHRASYLWVRSTLMNARAYVFIYSVSAILEGNGRKSVTLLVCTYLNHAQPKSLLKIKTRSSHAKQSPVSISYRIWR